VSLRRWALEPNRIEEIDLELNTDTAKYLNMTGKQNWPQSHDDHQITFQKLSLGTNPANRNVSTMKFAAEKLLEILIIFQVLSSRPLLRMLKIRL
jgi:hypothetical protein